MEICFVGLHNTFCLVGFSFFLPSCTVATSGLGFRVHVRLVNPFPMLYTWSSVL